ncbi:MAG: hypothetical protein CMN85_10995 [Spongiibacteraceae bacterium]|uniref:hypothetical protein n=1 Tax=uncultured Haliea sp. TaxID=622616 RepID=UPI000C4FCE65|nr:hypothetical protein [Spongiibacteraceae bacterium]|tara:strand:- start:6885 stop:7187 length:303 start_codon:yes stop_codon:yes gene_type:complete
MTPTERALKITAAAMEISQARIADVMVTYLGHIDGLTVYAHPAGSDYRLGAKRPRLLDWTVYLDAPDADFKLQSIEIQLAQLKANGPIATAPPDFKLETA